MKFSIYTIYKHLNTFLLFKNYLSSLITFCLTNPKNRLILNILISIFVVVISIYNSDPLYCDPTGDGQYSWNDDLPAPEVNYSRKPVWINQNSEPIRYENELPIPTQNGESSYHTQRAELSATPIQRAELSATPIQRAELSATPVQRAELSATPVQIAELHGGDLNHSSTTIDTDGTSMVNHNGSLPSNINELRADTSVRSSMQVENGSRIDNNEQMREVGYLPPDSTLVPAPFDPTERMTTSPKVDSFKDLCFKYYTIGRRKIHWEIWAKNTKKHTSYEEFKTNWDPNINVRKSIAKDIKQTFKADWADLKSGGTRRDATPRTIRNGPTTRAIINGPTTRAITASQRVEQLNRRRGSSNR
jgi:hypothetical protein